MKQYRVTMARRETYEYSTLVSARNEDEALELVQEDEDWAYPEDPVNVEEENDIQEV